MTLTHVLCGTASFLIMSGALDHEPRPLVPDSEYELAYVDYSTALMFKGAAKVVVRFRILTMGEFHGEIIERWYRVKRLAGAPKKRGNFVVGSSSDFYRDYCRLLGRPSRNDRISPVGLQGKIVIGSTRTVLVDALQRPLEDCLKYSVIDRLLRVVS